MDVISIQPAATLEVETRQRSSPLLRLQSAFQRFSFRNSSVTKVQPHDGSSQLTVRDTIDMLPDAVCIFSAQGEVVAANANFSAMLGEDAELRCLLTDKSKSDLYSSLIAVTSRKAAATAAVAVSLDFIEGNLSIRAILFTNHTWELRASRDRLSAMLIGRERLPMKTEHSAQTQCMGTPTKARDPSPSQVDEKRQFIRCVCHEVRTPLSVIYSALYLLDNMSAQYKDLALTEAIQEAKLSCQSATDTMNALLLHEQLESRSLVLRPARVNAYSFLEDCVSAFHPATALWDITFTLSHVSKFDLFMSVSAEEFGLAMRALINNGVRYTPPKGMVRVVVSSVLDDGSEANFDPKATFVRISVSDSGSGLTQEARLALLVAIEKFTPSKNETEQGHGVALSVVHGIAKLHGGRIGVESVGADHGSTFFVELPILEKVWSPTLLSKGRVVNQGTHEVERTRHLKKLAFTVRKAMKISKLATGGAFSSERSSIAPCIDDAIVSKREMQTEVQTMAITVIPEEVEETKEPKLSEMIISADEQMDEERKRSLRVLLVDDVRTCRRMCARVLEVDGCVCDEACDGSQAVEMVRLALLSGEPYDCILMDASMPKMTGSEATRAIREMGCHVKIFGVTGDSLPEDVQRFMDSGANGVCIKPLRKTELDEVIRGVRESLLP